MCGRYTLSATPDEIAHQFEVDVRENFPARYNIAPSQPIGIITVPEISSGSKQDKSFRLVRWGFLPEWAVRPRKTWEKERAPLKPMINARGETIGVKPAFRQAFKRRRCLIPANGFYEWKGRAGAKVPYYLSPRNQNENMPAFAFAGIWETILDPGGGEMDGAAIVTIASGPDLKPIHGREPVTIAPEHYQEWLSTDERDIADLNHLLKPAPAGFWQSHTVDPAIGNVRHEGARLIEPVDIAKNGVQQARLF